MLAVLMQDLDPSGPALFTLNEWVVSLLLATVIPLVLGVLYRDSAPNWVKVVFGLAVTTAVTLLKEAIQDDGSAVVSGETLLQFFMIYVPQIAMYYGVWRPLDVNKALGAGIIGPPALDADPAINRTERTAGTP